MILMPTPCSLQYSGLPCIANFEFLRQTFFKHEVQ